MVKRPYSLRSLVHSVHTSLEVTPRPLKPKQPFTLATSTNHVRPEVEMWAWLAFELGNDMP